MPAELDAWPAEADPSVPRIGLGLLICPLPRWEDCYKNPRGCACALRQGSQALPLASALGSLYLQTGRLGLLGLEASRDCRICSLAVYEKRLLSYSTLHFPSCQVLTDAWNAGLLGLLSGRNSPIEGFGQSEPILLDLVCRGSVCRT